MSVAEKLKAEGRLEGISQGISQGLSKGLWVGRIQSLEEFLGLPVSSPDELGAKSTEDLEKLHSELHQTYEKRFKQA